MSEETFTRTPRLEIRRFAAEDAAALSAYRSDPEVARYQGWDPFTVEAARDFIAEMAAAAPGVPGAWFQFALALRPGGALVGDIGLRRRDDAPELADIGYTLARAHQGRGLASEAVSALISVAAARWGVRRVRATVDARNLASLALARRIGMREVEVLETVWRGEPCVERVFELQCG